jgi:hypothetical protein
MLAVCMPMHNVQAGIVLFDLQGKAGFGLLPGNENSAVTVSPTPGTGGETSPGIFFDDVSKQLTINVGWGIRKGFTNLTGDATVMHIHQASSSAFTASGGAVINLHTLAGFSSSASNGGLNSTLTLTAAQETSLLSGLYYINVHTSVNPGGEIRGNLVAVPEPSSVALVALVGVPVVIARMRARRKSLAS